MPIDCRARIPIALVVALLQVPAGGCATLVGAAIGESHQKAAANRRRLMTAKGVYAAARGDRVVLQLRDGRHIAGVVVGLERRAADEYARAYEDARARKPEAVLLPALGAARWRGSRATTLLELAGFEVTGAVLLSKNKSRLVPFAEISGLAGAGTLETSGEVLERLLTDGHVPALSVLVLEGVGERIRLEDVERADLPERPSSGVEPILAGMLVDAMLIFSLLTFNLRFGR